MGKGNSSITKKKTIKNLGLKLVNGKQHSVFFLPTGMKGLPQNVLLNFRLEFPKSDLTIYLPSGISEIFCQMVSTPGHANWHQNHKVINVLVCGLVLSLLIGAAFLLQDSNIPEIFQVFMVFPVAMYTQDTENHTLFNGTQPLCFWLAH